MGTTPMIDVFGVSLASRSRSATSRSISSLRLRHTQLLLRGGARTPLEPLEPPRCSAADGDLKKRGDVEQPKTERWKNFLVDHLTLESQESIVFSKEQREGPFLKKHFPENGDILTPKAREFLALHFAKRTPPATTQSESHRRHQGRGWGQGKVLSVFWRSYSIVDVSSKSTLQGDI
jgi:hypothetical protein